MKIIITIKDTDNIIGLKEDIAMQFEGVADIVSIDTADVGPKSEEGAECPICHGTGRIGTTNWLTKNMTKKQIAEEKAQAIAEHEQYIKTEVAREIFEEIEKAHDECIWIDITTRIGYLQQTKFEDKLAELKNKYTEGQE
jgi:hypothetical protein